ncbi:hypothetical protein IAR50_004218 [Cryptococcus sp. DSM 104548]
MEAEHGPKSVCYLSFESLYFPHRRPDIIGWMLQTLQKAGIPVIPVLFALPSGFKAVPQDFLDEFKYFKEYCHVTFAPQWQVLNHVATGFFITHCGSNSKSETIQAEVPIVAMPFFGDQGEIAALLTEVFKIGIDIKRTNTSTNPSHTTLYDGTKIVETENAIKEVLRGIWARMTGREGEEMRKRVTELKQRMKQSVESGRIERDLARIGLGE